eukprot:Unigene4591_Nuclearia_a/m.14013 Unigene4591_Nuclearia_a/g.14013  ORF Unigene4591_Nuclearia_a/g.14013 Unigene4591_Nuclearia_a/m.14013 type:complete len:342 (+) Unigene4591_Nuclearia_a:200-1225(+)
MTGRSRLSYEVRVSLNVALIAVTTVARTNGEGEARRDCSSGRNLDGLISVRRPRQSATMLRVPSSSLSQLLNSRPQISSANGASCRPSSRCASCEIISFSALRSRYCRLGCCLISLTISGRYLPRLPTLMLPIAKAAADFMSSDTELKSDNTVTCSCAWPLRSIRRPISPSVSSARYRLDSATVSVLMLATKPSTVARDLAAGTAAHSVAMACDSDMYVCLALAMLSLARGICCSRSIRASNRPVSIFTTAANRSSSACSDAPCSSGEATSSRAGGTTVSFTAARAALCTSSTLMTAASDSGSSCRSVSVTSWRDSFTMLAKRSGASCWQHCGTLRMAVSA